MNDDDPFPKTDFDDLKKREQELVTAAFVDNKYLSSSLIGERVVINAKSGSYFCVLKSIQIDESLCNVKVEDAWKVDLGRQTTPDNKFINFSLSTISIAHLYSGKEFELRDVIDIDASEDVINKMRSVIEELR